MQLPPTLLHYCLVGFHVIYNRTKQCYISPFLGSSSFLRSSCSLGCPHFFGRPYSMLSSFFSLCSIKGCVPSKVVFHQRSSSIKGCLPSKVVFHERSSSIKGCLPSKVVFHQRPHSIKGRLPSNVVFLQRSSSIKSSFIEGRLQSKVVFHQMWSSVKGPLPLKVVFHHIISHHVITIPFVEVNQAIISLAV